MMPLSTKFPKKLPQKQIKAIKAKESDGGGICYFNLKDNKPETIPVDEVDFQLLKNKKIASFAKSKRNNASLVRIHNSMD